ncbi:MAG: TetR/AcrR family transcriptional regulator [Parvibaculaceae bacterium]|nr:TetR/AcrR family transcriptional regulator [Parvibaculaceae bacterium]
MTSHAPTTQRAAQKLKSKNRLLRVASRALRKFGASKLSINDVTAQAGLTHGAFYAHFKNKRDLLRQAFHAAFDHRETWLATASAPSPDKRKAQLIASYLTPEHRDHPENGCAFAACALDVARGEPEAKQAFEEELKISLARVEGLLTSSSTTAEKAEAINLISTCVGAMVLSRAVDDPQFSQAILDTARDLSDAQSKGKNK